MPDLSDNGRAVHPLLTALSRPAADTVLDQLPPELARSIDRMSPISNLSALHAGTIVLAHDVADTVVPIAESRQLRRALSNRSGLHYTEFTMFQHLDPTVVRLPVTALARELIKFFRTVSPIFRIASGPEGPRLNEQRTGN